MIVTDATALASLGRADLLGPTLDAFGVRTTPSSVERLERTCAFHGPSGEGARAAMDLLDQFVVRGEARSGLETSRVDAAQGSCAALAGGLEADALVTDDLLALPELTRFVPCAVVPTPVVLSALVRRGALAPGDARFRLEDLVVRPRWLAGPVRRRVGSSFEAATG